MRFGFEQKAAKDRKGVNRRGNLSLVNSARNVKPQPRAVAPNLSNLEPLNLDLRT